ncbi:MAG: hypothetical protein KIT36_20480 [Alphaproteobacteria bacterium]|nr:hypothetical protein [Alphaproteobacteria bacterium]
MGNTSVRTVIFGFIAGAVAYLIFHQGGFWLLNAAGMLKTMTYSMAPTRPFGLPVVITFAFWTGFWGVAAAFVVPQLSGGLRGVLGWILFAAVVPTLVEWFIVEPARGHDLGGGFQLPGVALAPAVFGFWGFGMWLIMQLLQRLSGKRATG